MSITKSHKKNKYNNRRTKNKNKNRNRNNKGRRSRNNNNKGRRSRNKNNKKYTKKYRVGGDMNEITRILKSQENTEKMQKGLNKSIGKLESNLGIKTINLVKDLLSKHGINKETLKETLENNNKLRHDLETMMGLPLPDNYSQRENTEYKELEKPEERKELIIKYINDIKMLLNDDAFNGISIDVKEKLLKSLIESISVGGGTSKQPRYMDPIGQQKNNKKNTEQQPSGVTVIDVESSTGLCVSLSSFKDGLLWMKSGLSSKKINIGWSSDYLSRITNFFSNRESLPFIGRNFRKMNPINFNIFDYLRKIKFNHSTFDPLKSNEKLMNLFSLTETPFFGNVYTIPTQFKGITWDEEIYRIIDNIKSLEIKIEKEQIMKKIFEEINSTQLIDKMQSAIKDNTEATTLLTEIKNTLTNIEGIVELFAGVGQGVEELPAGVGETLGEVAAGVGEVGGFIGELVQLAKENPNMWPLIGCISVGGLFALVGLVFPPSMYGAVVMCTPLMTQIMAMIAMAMGGP